MAAGAVFIIGASTVAGCSSPARPKISSFFLPGPPVPLAALNYGSPLQAVLSWFFAVNHKEAAAAVSHFVPAEAGMMDWGGGDTSTWPAFSALQCRQLSGSTSTAELYCSFHESPAPSDGQVDDFWTVSLRLQPDGRWLITNYGQG